MEATEILMALMSFLLVVIGYFLKQQIAVTKELTTSVNSLAKTVAVIENKNENLYSNNATITHRLNAHAKRLDSHEAAIAVIKTKICK